MHIRTHISRNRVPNSFYLVSARQMLTSLRVSVMSGSILSLITPFSAFNFLSTVGLPPKLVTCCCSFLLTSSKAKFLVHSLLSAYIAVALYCISILKMLGKQEKNVFLKWSPSFFCLSSCVSLHA